MMLESRTTAEWGERRHRYICPECGAQASREASETKARRAALRNVKPSRRYTRRPIRCAFYKQHNTRGRWIKCESCEDDGLSMIMTYKSARQMLQHMQKCCRGTPELCALERACAGKYEA